jgi:hypothetical protein
MQILLGSVHLDTTRAAKIGLKNTLDEIAAGECALHLETQEIVPGTYRSLITATASTAAPLGWVTVRKVGLPLIGTECL